MPGNGASRQANDHAVGLLTCGDRQFGGASPQDLLCHQRQYADREQLEECSTIAEVAMPKIRLLLDAPQPLKATVSKKRWRPFYGPSLKINGCAELRPERWLQSPMIVHEPGLRLLGRE